MDLSKELFRIAKAISDTGIKTASANARSVLIDMAENGGLDWKSIAFECIQQMSEDQLEDVCNALDIYYLDSNASESLLSTAEDANLWETIGRECLEQMSVDEAASVCEVLEVEADEEDNEEDDEITAKDVNGHVLTVGDTVKLSDEADDYDEDGDNSDTFEITEIEHEKYGTYLTLEKIPSREIQVVGEYEVEFVE